MEKRKPANQITGRGLFSAFQKMSLMLLFLFSMNSGVWARFFPVNPTTSFKDSASVLQDSKELFSAKEDSAKQEVSEKPKKIIQIVSSTDFMFLEQLTRDVLESSRIYPGQIISPDFGANQTGGTLIRPGGRDCYPSFWIRDYALSLESGLIPKEEQKHMLKLTAETQCDQTWITKGGSVIPVGAIADHIRIDDSLPIYFPGTYDYVEQGNLKFGVFPPISDQFFFIHMAFCYVKLTADLSFLQTRINGISLIDRLELAFKVPATGKNKPVVYNTDNLRGVDFGFRDVITITGDLCMPSIFKYRASNELSWLFNQINQKQKAEYYATISARLKNLIPELFYDENGMLRASTGKSSQPDVWSTALAVYFGIIDGTQLEKTSRYLTDAYLKGILAYNGNIRHILTTDDFNDSTAWEFSYAQKNTYQNGAYWGTPTGWVVYAIAKTNPESAAKLATEYIQDLKMNDYRKGENFGAPFECFHPSGHAQNPVYLTSVTCPFAAFRKCMDE